MEFAFLAEKGPRFRDTNFSWEMHSMIPLFFIFVIEWTRWLNEAS